MSRKKYIIENSYQKWREVQTKREFKKNDHQEKIEKKGNVIFVSLPSIVRWVLH